MSTSSEQTTLTVALIGNPNTGKSTLFSALVGIHQHVGNYPGVTVEKKTGRMEHAGRRFEIIDLPGLFSLAPRSRDEMVAVDVLLGRRRECPVADAVVCIVDAGNLERNLYLLSQVLELELPTVVAVNMLDVAEKHGMVLDLDRLQRQLPVPLVAIQANRRVGIAELKTTLAEIVGRPRRRAESPFPEAFECEVTQLELLLAKQKFAGIDQVGSGQWAVGSGHSAVGREQSAVHQSSIINHQSSIPRCLLRRLLLDSSGYLQKALLGNGDDRLVNQLQEARRRLAASDCAVPAVETAARYAWARRVLRGVVTEPRGPKTMATDRIDRVLTHRFWGTLVFVLLMVLVFQSVFLLGRAGEELIAAAAGAVGGWVEAGMAQGALRSLVVHGVIGGVGGVLRFLPQIVILFLFIAVLEGCGYMARAAYLMDKMMVRVGLSGRSFIPMLSCFACAVPGIMGTRVIENERDRLTTILVAPLMTCSARLPVYAVLIGAFVPRRYLGGLLGLQGLTMVGLYALGIVTAVAAALVLKKTILRGEAPLFLLELPSYKWPSPRAVLYRAAQRCWLFVRCAGTLILAVSIMVWAALYYPHNAERVEAPFRARAQQLQAQLAALEANDPGRTEVRQELAQLDRQIAGAYQRQSLLGRMGHVLEPVVRPLGWDWRIGCAVIASLPARELVVATMAVIYDAGETPDLQSAERTTRFQTRLHEATWDDTDPPRKVFNLPVALSIMVFFALCAQCAATLAVIRRETGSWRWPAFTFAYMTVLAYLGALTTYQLGTWLCL
jgi:ferrous iron transport protein B